MFFQADPVSLLSMDSTCSTFTFNYRVFHKHAFSLFCEQGMGRSVPSWRKRVETELQNLIPYRRALLPRDQAAFDALMDEIRQRRTAGGMLPSLNAWQPAVLSMLVGLMAEIERLSKRIDELEGRHEHG